MYPAQRLKKMEFNATFIVTIITFIVFVFLMNKILYAPILNIMEERRNVIDGNYKLANDCDEKSQDLVAEKEEKIAEARNVARGKYTVAGRHDEITGVGSIRHQNLSFLFD